MTTFLDIAETQKSLEQNVVKMFSEFEAKLSRIPPTKVTIAGLSEEFATFKEQTMTILKLLREQISVLSISQDIIEMRHRRKYLLFNGIPEDPSETVSSRITGIITEQLKIPDVSAVSFKACHRLGKLTNGRNRPVLVRFLDLHLKSQVWQKKTSCKGTTYAISEFLTPRRQELFMQARKTFGMRSCWSLDGNIFVKLASGVRERIELMEDIERLKVARVKQPPTSTSTPKSGAAAAVSDSASAPSEQSGRSRRAERGAKTVS